MVQVEQSSKVTFKTSRCSSRSRHFHLQNISQGFLHNEISAKKHYIDIIYRSFISREPLWPLKRMLIHLMLKKDKCKFFPTKPRIMYQQCRQVQEIKRYPKSLTPGLKRVKINAILVPVVTPTCPKAVLENI